MYSFLLNILIIDRLSVCGGTADWGTRDPRRVLGLCCLVGFRMVLIRWAP